MPKIIENVRGQLIDVAKKQIRERGYAGMTIRSVAGACNLAIGTVYNYFKSKDVMIATFMVEDWLENMKEARECSSTDAREVLKSLYDALLRFVNQYGFLFHDAAAERVFAATRERHTVLRAQLAEVILPVCESECKEERAFHASFAAEALIAWTVAGEDFDKIADAILKVIKK